MNNKEDIVKICKRFCVQKWKKLQVRTTTYD